MTDAVAADLAGLARLTPRPIRLRSFSDHFLPIQGWEDRWRSTHREWPSAESWAKNLAGEINDLLLSDAAKERISILDLSGLIDFPFFELATAIRRGYLDSRGQTPPEKPPILGLSWTARCYADSTARCQRRS